MTAGVAVPFPILPPLASSRASLVDIVFGCDFFPFSQHTLQLKLRCFSHQKALLLVLAGSILYASKPSILAGLSKLRLWRPAPQSAPMSTSTTGNPYLNENGKESPWKYPRPPDLQKTSRHLKVVYGEGDEQIVLADTTDAYRVLETSHPPTYYLPPDDVKLSLLKQNNRHTFCEWKGSATYYDFKPPSGGDTIKSRIWTYESPTEKFKPIKGYVSFYAGPWKCFVDGEEVKPQPGDFYGGWMTSDIDGGKRGVKGGPGTFGW